MARYPLEFEYVNECRVPKNHKLNRDGYFRLSVGGRMVMYHRHIWETSNGPIPTNQEIHHKCKNRACSTLDHLQLIDKSEHKALSNKERKGSGYFRAVRARTARGQFLPSTV